MPGLSDVLYPAAIGAIVSVVGSFLTHFAESRRKIDESLRERRATDYLKLWTITAAVPKWPPATLKIAQLKQLTAELKEWYFAGGGMYLSIRAQRAYKDVQESITAVTASSHDDAPVSDRDYDHVQKACSSLRTALTNDLLSRSRSLWT